MKTVQTELNAAAPTDLIFLIYRMLETKIHHITVQLCQVIHSTINRNPF